MPQMHSHASVNLFFAPNAVYHWTNLLGAIPGHIWAHTINLLKRGVEQRSTQLWPTMASYKFLMSTLESQLKNKSKQNIANDMLCNVVNGLNAYCRREAEESTPCASGLQSISLAPAVDKCLGKKAISTRNLLQFYSCILCYNSFHRASPPSSPLVSVIPAFFCRLLLSFFCMNFLPCFSVSWRGSITYLDHFIAHK